MARNERVTSKTTSFYGLLKITTVKPFFITPAFFVAFLLAGVFYYFFKDVTEFSELIEYSSNTIASISATLLGIVIAGLAILISLSQGKLLSIFLQKNILQKFLFPFWVFTGAWALSTLVCISLKLFEYFHYKVLLYIMTFEVFVFVYALLGTVSLMGHAIRFGIYIAQLTEILNDESSE
ncbi:MAG: hypothetical protein ACQEXX_29660 [Bacillota bacterium]